MKYVSKWILNVFLWEDKHAILSKFEDYLFRMETVEDEIWCIETLEDDVKCIETKLFELFGGS